MGFRGPAVRPAFSLPLHRHLHRASLPECPRHRLRRSLTHRPRPRRSPARDDAGFRTPDAAGPAWRGRLSRRVFAAVSPTASGAFSRDGRALASRAPPGGSAPRCRSGGERCARDALAPCGSALSCAILRAGFGTKPAKKMVD